MRDGGPTQNDEQGREASPPSRPCLHYCEHPGCTKRQGFGFAVGRAQPNWLCSEYQPTWLTRERTFNIST
ncbi:hypothetical protein CN071_24920 [Sinorhizobium meliloti]|nr:hypothetical protein [Sinorhizobium meliloti]RVI53176.1 hypothetical protein CN195_09295 [Sinorhizobium meliloti]RVP59551.1 hypothetical protein CN071_24920 [Sinorhizobium meliloti]RVQ36463.1 hypothetical protein CN068_19950 [Sinorhizobium meliloti]